MQSAVYNPTRALTSATMGLNAGQHYFNARYLWANIARFTSADAPFADQRPEDGQSWNMYAYVRNNPLRWVDLTGRTCQRRDDGSLYDDLDEEGCAAVDAENRSLRFSASAVENRPEVRELSAEVSAEHIRMQDEARRRAQREAEKREQQLSHEARAVAEGIASNQSVQLVATVSDCAASQVPLAESGSMPIGPTLVGAGQPWIPTRRKFGGATGGTSVACIALRKALPIRMRLPGVTNAGVKVAPTFGGFLGRAVPIVGWGVTAYNIGSCVAEGPK